MGRDVNPYTDTPLPTVHFSNTRAAEVVPAPPKFLRAECTNGVFISGLYYHILFTYYLY